MNAATKNDAFHQRLALLIGTREPFRWAKQIGIPAATFDRIWNKRDIPKQEHLCRIAKTCGVSLDWLLLGESAEANRTDKTRYGVVPLIGLANCGIAQGWFNESERRDRILLPSFMAGNGAYAVLCRGHSMVPAGIDDGDVCVIDPNRPVESGKPVLIRTKSVSKGGEITLSTIKLFDSQDDENVTISGWLEPDETGYQSKFTEKRLKKCVTEVVSVGNVLKISIPETVVNEESVLQADVLADCLRALEPFYRKTDSKKFADLVLFLYGRATKNGVIDLKTLAELAEKLEK